MPDKKITISWDEVSSPQVDATIRQQDALVRAQEHYQPHVPPVTPVPVVVTPRRGSTSIWYSTVFYMAVFGVIGGLVAWVSAEVVWLVMPNKLEEFDTAILQFQQVEELVRNGTMTQEQAGSAIALLEQTYQENPYVRIINDPNASEEEKKRLIEQLAQQDTLKNLLQLFVWFSLVAIPLAFFLASGEQIVSQNWRGVVVNGSVAIALALFGGIGGGFVASVLYGILGGGQDSTLWIQVLARSIAWAVLGLSLVPAPGLVLRSWKRLAIGMVGGFLGGFLGGMLFDPIALVTHSVVLSRLAGIVAIGFFSGVGTGLIENVAKAGWLRVTAGLIAGKQFIIYKNPTYLGSSPQCEIYLFKDRQVSPRHASIQTVRGGYELEDLNSPTGTFVNGRPVSRTRLRTNDQVQIGATVFQFQEKERTAR